MIVRPRPDGGLLLVRQHDHAALTAPLARAWRFDVPDREATAEAAGFHDNGWIEWDARPRVDEEGRPRSFKDMPPDDYRAIWRRGFRRAWERGAWVGLLVSLHGAQFFESKDDPEDARLLAAERERQEAAYATLARDDAARGFHLVRWLDGLSLFLCGEFGASWTAPVPRGVCPVQLTASRADGAVVLDPWPFTPPSIEVEVPTLATERSRWPDDDAFRADYEEAATRHVSVRLLPKKA